ncbi:protein-tyrosine phosphatase-like protein [Aspergillus ambiguus]|uniref:putative protein tyrosine phosphatase (Pyp1) n=1 Tax=Aspergillus ambiguus TaxID=176160 RepID=UPI003CCE53B7
MSAMTGPRSPTSPWPQESPNLQIPPSTPAAFFSLCDNRPSPFNTNVGSQHTASECSGPSYFSLGVEHSNNARNARDPLSAGHPAITSPKPQILSQRNVLEGYMSPAKSGSPGGERGGAPLYTLTVGNNFQSRSPAPDYFNVTPQSTQASSLFVSPERCAEILQSPQYGALVFDIRPYTHFAKGHIKDSLNLCIPTTLLKRPSFNTQKLANTFTNDSDKEKFAQWPTCEYIIVYDAATSEVKDAAPLANVLRKFSAEGWNGKGLILRGGLNGFSRKFSALIEQQESPPSGVKKPCLMKLDLPSAAPIAGGCALPDASHPSIPFFGNIRQHMDLLGGVGQIPLQLPDDLTESKRHALPAWLRVAANDRDKGYTVSEQFLELEKNELERMKRALSYEKSTDSTLVGASDKFRVAGIEKGAKNRYNDIYPFDHSRVKLQDVSPDGCDYVNASFLKAEYSDNRYIATQAPVPDTFADFWRVVWEQDVRLVVSLTAEVERGQTKCHPYWVSGDYGPFQVNNFSEKYIYLNSPGMEQVDAGPDPTLASTNEDSNNPCIIVRHFGVSHSAFPFQPLREVMQLQYPYWPDFGTTSQPSHLVRLVEQCNKMRNATATTPCSDCGSRPGAQRPVVVHCSAGCGRTGTFCTVDSVLDMLSRQRAGKTTCPDCSSSNGNCGDGWLQDEKTDLIAKTVSDFRKQRPSMVQNLSQYVLCYESVLEWITSQMANAQR